MIHNPWKEFKMRAPANGLEGSAEQLLLMMLKAQSSWEISWKSLRLLPTQTLEKGQKGWSCLNLF